MIKMILLSIANIIVLVAFLFFLDIAGVTHFYTDIKNFFKTDEIKSAEQAPGNNFEKDIMYRQQFNMTMAAISLKQKELDKEKASLKTLSDTVEAKRQEIENKEKNLYDRISRLDQEEKEKNDYQKKVDQLAQNYANMPPNLAMERLLSLKDDLLAIDTMDAMDRNAAAAGVASIVPYIFSLMPPEDSGRIMKKMATSE